MTRTAVVVGASIAGVRVVQSLRRAGYEGTVHLIGAEQELPYDKPALSKSTLAADPIQAPPLLTAVQVTELDLRLSLGVAATRLDVAGRTVTLADGSSLGFDDLVIATGAHARPSPWHPPSGVHVLRSIEDCRSLRADLALGGPVVVVGGGFIGAEVASTCRKLGHEVTIVDPVPLPMARAVGKEIGARLVNLHHRHGTGTRLGIGVEDITGNHGHLTVSLTDGTSLSAATAVVGIGAEPNDRWLYDSGLAVEDGVLCDEFGRTSGPGIFAVGDVATWRTPDGDDGRRGEHWTAAVEQARCVAHTITHPEAPMAHTPTGFVWSDQYDWTLHVVGDISRAAGTSVIEAPDRPDRFASLWRGDTGELRGASIANWPAASIRIRRSLLAGAEFGTVEAQVKELASTS